MPNSTYIGRFAPTPSGPLHFGSVVAALGSYLQAKYQNGKWLVRIDDVDTQRSRKDAASLILKQLEHFGLLWDEEVVFQSKRTDLYQLALENLKQSELIYVCQCTRKQIGIAPYPGTCRSLNLPFSDTYSLRIKTLDKRILLTDRLQDDKHINLKQSQGDFIIRRSDGLFAYHLATVVDDHEQGVTEIIRGADLYDATASQRYLQECLSYNRPSYLHLPIAIDKKGKKISKSDGEYALDMAQPSRIIHQALRFLGQDVPDLKHFRNLEELLSHAIEHWQIDYIPQQQSEPIKIQ